VEVVGTAANGDDAVDAIRNLQPDLVFLDVNMPGLTGPEVVRTVGAEAMPATIFVTAHDAHALEAFDLEAIDYLVKPFDDERFTQALRRAREALELSELGRLRNQLIAALQGSGPAAPAVDREKPEPAYLERIPIESRGKIQVVDVNDIDFIVSSGPYAELHAGDKTHLIRESMKSLEDRLDPARFVRIHRSIMVRLTLVETLHKAAGGDYEVQLKSGARLRVSRTRREELERRLGITSRRSVAADHQA
jgi:two-component system LytT family response regulator